MRRHHYDPEPLTDAQIVALSNDDETLAAHGLDFVDYLQARVRERRAGRIPPPLPRRIP